MPAPAASRAREEFAGLRRAEILNAATRLFAKKGYAETRCDDIAAAAGIAKGTVYLYFAGKEEIYAAAVKDAVAEVQALAGKRIAAADTLRDGLMAFVLTRLEFWADNKALYELLLTVGRTGPHRRRTREMIRQGQAALVALFERAAERGDIAKQEFLPVAEATMDMVRGAAERRVEGASTMTPEAEAGFIVGVVLGQLGR